MGIIMNSSRQQENPPSCMHDDIQLWADWLGFSPEEDEMVFYRKVFESEDVFRHKTGQSILLACESLVETTSYLRKDKNLCSILELSDYVPDRQAFRAQVLPGAVKKQLLLSRETLLPTIKEFLSSQNKIGLIQRLQTYLDDELARNPAGIDVKKSCLLILHGESGYLSSGIRKLSELLGKKKETYELELEKELTEVAKKPLFTALKILSISGGCTQRKLSKQELPTLKAMLHGMEKMKCASSRSEMREALRSLGLISAAKGKHDQPITFNHNVKDFLDNTFNKE